MEASRFFWCTELATAGWQIGGWCLRGRAQRWVPLVGAMCSEVARSWSHGGLHLGRPGLRREASEILNFSVLDAGGLRLLRETLAAQILYWRNKSVLRKQFSVLRKQFCEGRCLNVVVLRRQERTFWRSWSFCLHGSIGWWVAMLDPARQGAARAKPSRPPWQPQGRPSRDQVSNITVYVDESVPFEGSGRLACTRASVLRALGPSSFQLHRIDKRFTRTGRNIFGAVLPALVPTWPGSVFEGLAQRGPMPACCHFACTGAYLLAALY